MLRRVVGQIMAAVKEMQNNGQKLFVPLDAAGRLA
jgi:hypothetical protein